MLVIANLRLTRICSPNCWPGGSWGMSCLKSGTGIGGNLALCLFEDKSQREANTDYQKYGRKVTTPFKIKIVDDT